MPHRLKAMSGLAGAVPQLAGAHDEPSKLVETHISLLFFVGDLVYKLKKPVRFPFVDQRTREARERLCHREVELNSRLAPDCYLGVASLVGPDGEPWDHLVLMRRMPEERRMSALVLAGDPRAAGVLDDLASLLAGLHRTADRSPLIDACATRSAVQARWEEIFEEVEPSVGTVLDAQDVDQVRRLAEQYLAGREPLFARRIERGAICDGHGDLMADDIFCLDDGPRVLDCIEFDETYRYVDVANDVAFLVMDLERLGAPELGERFVDAYEKCAGQALPRSLVDFYVAYRAMVRSMVGCLRTTQLSGEEAEAGTARSRDLLELCHRHLRRAVPWLVAVGGLPGTGKSTVAQSLSDVLGAELIRSDVVRKEMVGIDPTTATAGGYQEGLYQPEMTGAVYAAMIERAEATLGMGQSVVVDASFSKVGQRAAVREAASRSAAGVVELRCVLDRATADHRMEARAATGGDASDATTGVAAAMAEAFEAWAEAVEISTSGTPEKTAALAMAALDRVR